MTKVYRNNKLIRNALKRISKDGLARIILAAAHECLEDWQGPGYTQSDLINEIEKHFLNAQRARKGRIGNLRAHILDHLAEAEAKRTETGVELDDEYTEGHEVF
jgi:hypothetical protein